MKHRPRPAPPAGSSPLAGLAEAIRLGRSEAGLACPDCGHRAEQLELVTAQRDLARRVAIALEAELAELAVGEPRLLHPGRTYVLEVTPFQTDEQAAAMRQAVAQEAERTGARFLVLEGRLLELGDLGPIEGEPTE